MEKEPINLYPLLLKPIFQERIWGGRMLETLYSKPLPPGKIIGESWEVSDRPDACNEIQNGPLAGKTLRWLMETHPRELLGSAHSNNGRYPLLVKILDARQKLSLQVHPPASRAASLKGEPKTEMWFIAKADPGAELYVGLKAGVSKEQFSKKIGDGTVADCFHRVPVKNGDAMFLPSGRVHAIGSGLVIFEIQQNSDTTYRVFDWNRVDDSGKPRQLHVRESLECINFEDFEPALIPTPPASEPATISAHPLVEHELFNVEAIHTAPGAHLDYSVRNSKIFACVEGEVLIEHSTDPVTLRPGMFCLVPAQMQRVKISTPNSASFLLAAEPGRAE